MKFNRQGRTTSDTMRVAAFTRWLEQQPKPKPPYCEDYKGFTIGPKVKRSGWLITENGALWPASFSSLAKAREAVDRCLALRLEMESEG